MSTADPDHEIPVATPLAEEAAQIFSSMQHHKKNIGLEQYWPVLEQLGKKLLPHTRSLKDPIDRDAFLQVGRGVTIKPHYNVEGNELGWTFEGNVRRRTGNVHVDIEKTDAWNGQGVTLGLFVSVPEENMSLRCWATTLPFKSGIFYVEFTKDRHTRYAKFERPASLFMKKPLTFVRAG